MCTDDGTVYDITVGWGKAGASVRVLVCGAMEGEHLAVRNR